MRLDEFLAESWVEEFGRESLRMSIINNLDVWLNIKRTTEHLFFCIPGEQRAANRCFRLRPVRVFLFFFQSSKQRIFPGLLPKQEQILFLTQIKPCTKPRMENTRLNSYILCYGQVKNRSSFSQQNRGMSRISYKRTFPVFRCI